MSFIPCAVELLESPGGTGNRWHLHLNDQIWVISGRTAISIHLQLIQSFYKCNKLTYYISKFSIMFLSNQHISKVPNFEKNNV